METSNIVALILGGLGFFISVIGYIVTPFLNLKSKRLEKRLENRFQLFDKILNLWECTHDSTKSSEEFAKNMYEINKLIQLYGHNHEIKMFRKVVEFYNSYAANQADENKKRFFEQAEAFFTYSFNKYRSEMAIGKLP